MKRIYLACIIDDDPIQVFTLKKVMEIIDFSENVTVYKNGQEALDNLIPVILSKKNIPDIILLDLNMPILDGWQFLDEFIKIPCETEITIYIVSSSVDPNDILKAESYDIVNNYVVKPITVNKLRQVLADFTQTI